MELHHLKLEKVVRFWLQKPSRDLSHSTWKSEAISQVFCQDAACAHAGPGKSGGFFWQVPKRMLNMWPVGFGFSDLALDLRLIGGLSNVLVPGKCHTTTHQLHLSIRNELLRIRFFLDLQPLDFHFQSAQKPTQDAAFTRTTSRMAMTLREGQLQRIVVSGALILCCPASRCGFMIPESAAVGIFGAWSCPFEWI